MAHAEDCKPFYGGSIPLSVSLWFMMKKTTLSDLQNILKNVELKKILVVDAICLYMTELIPHDVLVVLKLNDINYQELFNINGTFLTKELFFLRFLQMQKKEIKNMINDIPKNEYIISPYGLLKGDLEFILTDVKNEEIYVTTSNVLFTHTMYCVLKPIKSLLLSILLSFKFLIKDLIEFIILTNNFFYIGNMRNDNVSFNNLEEAINFLEGENWKLNHENIKFYIKNKKEIFYDNFKFWKEHFKEENIHTCNCKLVAENNLENIFYGNLEKFVFHFKNYKENLKKREIILNFEEEKTINNPMTYYLHKILRIPFANEFKEKKKEVIKMPHKKVTQLKIIY